MFTRPFIGWHAQGPLSVVNITALVQALTITIRPLPGNALPPPPRMGSARTRRSRRDAVDRGVTRGRVDPCICAPRRGRHPAAHRSADEPVPCGQCPVAAQSPRTVRRVTGRSARTAGIARNAASRSAGTFDPAVRSPRPGFANARPQGRMDKRGRWESTPELRIDAARGVADCHCSSTQHCASL